MVSSSSYRESLDDIRLALLSQPGFDIPKRTRRVVAVAGVAGIGFVAMGSLVGGTDMTIEIDKAIHFTGYAILAFVFVLALRPILFVPALLALFAMGLLIEIVQPSTGRSFDLADAQANGIGIAVGTGIAITLRSIYAYVRAELATAAVRRKLIRFLPGSTILREGGRIDHFYVIKEGQVTASRRVNDAAVELGTLGPGNVIGLLGIVQGTPQYTTIMAVSRTTLYKMTLQELMDSAGGRQQPVSLVLGALADNLRELADRVSESGHGPAP